MRSLIRFYFFAIILPFAALGYFLFFTDNNTIFFILLMLFVFVYRPIIDNQRLIKKGVINKFEYWKYLTGIARLKYFKELYFEK